MSGELNLRDTSAVSGTGIHKALCAIKAAIASGGGVQKTRQAPMGYQFRGIEDFDNILCGLTAEHGVVMYPRILSKEIHHGTTAKGGYQSHVIVEMEWRFFCAEDGSHVNASTMGEAMDTQDTAFNKAMQASRKYAILMVLMIPTAGDDTEIYVPEPAAKAAVQELHHQEVAARAKANGPAELPKGDLLPAGEVPKRTRGPNKPKEPQQTAAEPTPANYLITDAKTIDVPAEITNPGAVLNGAEPFPSEPAQPKSLLARVFDTNTFGVLYATLQDAESSMPPASPQLQALQEAVVKRAVTLFADAKDMKAVTEGFELVSALGQPPVLKAAANAAYGRYRQP